MRKLLLAFTLINLCLIFQSSAQITFQKIFGGTNWDDGRAVLQTTDWGYMIGGTIESFGAGGKDVYLIKTDSNGATLWTKTFGGPSNDMLSSMQQTSDGGYIITGYTSSFGAGNTDVYLIKTDFNGNLMWSKTFGGIEDDNGISVEQTVDGGYIIAGNTISFGASYDIYLIKTDANGDTLWTKTYGGVGYENSSFVKQTTDGGYIISGSSNGFGPGNHNAYLIKTDANGGTLWSKTYGDSYGSSVKQTADGGYIIAGSAFQFLGIPDVYLFKVDSIGDLLWSKTYGGAFSSDGSSFQQTTDGGYAIVGSRKNLSTGNDDIYLIKTDTNGDILWTKRYGGTSNEHGISIRQTTDGGYILVGGREVSFLNRIYVIKTDSLGNSGCDEASAATIAAIPTSQVVSPATIVTAPLSIVTSPATIAGSGGTVTTLCFSTGIAESTIDNSFFILPNPSDGKFIISLELMIMKGKIEILNILGETIFTENIHNESKKEINLKNISGGIYIVRLFDGERYHNKKIIVENN